MTVKIRPYKHGGWEVDIVIQLDSGQALRKRLKSPVASKSGSLAWGQGHERYLIQYGVEPSSSPPAEPEQPRPKGQTRREVPTLAEFAPRYLEGYARANRQKPSSIDSKQSHLSHHLIPRFGDKRLDELDDEQIQRLKAALADKSSKTVNNILTTLNTLLSVAVQWGVLEQMPAKIRLLKVTRKDAAFYDFDEFERLVEAAAKIGPEVHLQVLLGGDAGLRPGEVRALHWTSIDFRRQQLTIERHEYKGQFHLPKHDKIRRVPMTDALTEALKAYRHLRGPLVLYRDEACRLLTPRTQRYWLGKAQRLANLPDKGPHTLRHTFCSHLAMRGAPTKAIQELAGHADLTTTQRYMHLSPATLDSSIRLLDRGLVGPRRNGPP